MKKVEEFYRDTPFNYTQDVDFYANNVLSSNQILEYSDLHNLLRKTNWTKFKPHIRSIIEFGCGTGWLTNSLTSYYSKDVTGIDFTSKALDIAKEVSRKLKIKPRYHLSDIFDYEDSKKYDLVISMGVLHHTSDCKKAFKKISTFVKPGGYIYVGLYHYYGRRPMLKFLQGYSRWHGEKSAYNLFKRMNQNMNNREHSYSWFRDQVLHPHETQHTLFELMEWIKDIGFSLESTSINKYKELDKFSESELFSTEKEMEDYSYKKNISKLEFSPGYFTICAKNNLA